MVSAGFVAGAGIAVKITPKGENVVPNERAKGRKGPACNDVDGKWPLTTIKTAKVTTYM